jgi:flavodoxin
MKKTMVAYFSASGSTAKLAKNLAAAAQADCYEIRPVTPYTAADLDWMNKQSRSSVEMSDPNFRPQLADKDAEVAQAEVIFVGFPIWWYREPGIIDSFLEAYDFTGKTVVPFFTSGGSGLGKGQERIAALAKGAKVLTGKRFSANAAEKELKNWLAQYL